MPARKDITGMRFNGLTAIEYIGARKYLWRCDCGNLKPYLAWPITSGAVKSCGCQANAHKVKHGHRPKGKPSRSYAVWQAMMQRCNDSNCKAYPRYGGRGIKVCSRWREYQNFLSDMGIPPDGLQLERIDNDAGYSPENCKWATRNEQATNRCTTHWVTFDGETRSVSQWAAHLGVTRDAIYKSINRTTR